MRLAVVSLKAFFGSLIALVGGLHPMIQTLAWLMPLDVVLGYMAGFKRKRVSSDRCFMGLMRKKVPMILLIAVAVRLETIWQTHFEVFGTEVGLAAAIAGGFILHEATSIAENLAILRVPLPRSLLEALEKYSKKEKLS